MAFIKFEHIFVGLAMCLLLLVPTPSNGAGPDKPVVASTAQTVDLATAITLALKNFPLVRIAEQNTAKYYYKYKEAKHSAILPQLNLTTLFGPVPNVAAGNGPPTFPNFSDDLTDLGVFVKITAEALQPIFTFGRLSNIRNAARAGYEASREDETDKTHELVHRVKTMYYGLAAVRSSLDFFSETQKNFDRASAEIDQLLKKRSAQITESDRLEFKVYEAELKRAISQAEEQEEKLMHAFNVVLGANDGEMLYDIRATGLKRVALKPLGFAEVKGYMQKHNPQLKQLNYLVDVRRGLMNVSHAEMAPLFFVGGYFNYTVAPGREDINNPFLRDDFNTLEGGVALGLRQSLDFHLLTDRYKQNKAEFSKARLERDLGTKILYVRLREKVIAMEKTYEQQRYSAKSFKAARSWFAGEMGNFEFGTVDLKRVVDAFKAYVSTKIEHTKSVLAYNLAISDVTRLTCKEVLPLQY